jgi:hypothetical protein
VTELITAVFNTSCLINLQSGQITMSLSKDNPATNAKDQTFLTKPSGKNHTSKNHHVRKCTWIGFDNKTSNKMLAMLIQESATDSRVILFDWVNVKIKAAILFPA